MPTPLALPPELVARSERRFTAAEVLRMLAAGVLGEDEPIELIDGRLIVVNPQGPAHGGTITRLQPRLHDVYRGRGLVRTQLPLALGDESLPEPDLAVVEPDPDDYTTRHPGAGDALLVIEIAHTSQELDLAKARLYGRAGVAACWVIDLARRSLTVFLEPGPGGYRSSRVLHEREDVELPRLDARWSVASLLPRPGAA